MMQRRIGLACLAIAVGATLLLAGCMESTNTGTNKPTTTRTYVGETVTFDEGAQQTMSIGALPAIADSDVKVHWEMPEGLVRVEGSLSWSDTGWDLQFDLGTGECPHSGTALNTTTGSNSPLTLTFEAEAGGNLAAGRWFLHAKCLNAEEHRLGSLTLTFACTIYHIEETTEG